MRMPGFSAEASLYRLSDSHHMAMQSAAKAEIESVVPQLLITGPHIVGCQDMGASPYRLSHICDEDGSDPVIFPKKTGKYGGLY